MEAAFLAGGISSNLNSPSGFMDGKKLGPADSEDLRGRSPDLPEVSGIMRIISFIEDRAVIKTILKHLGLRRKGRGRDASYLAPPARIRT